MVLRQYTELPHSNKYRIKKKQTYGVLVLKCKSRPATAIIFPLTPLQEKNLGLIGMGLFSNNKQDNCINTFLFYVKLV